MMNRSTTTFKSVTRSSPCPLCAGIDGCSLGEDSLICCRRSQGPQAGFVCLGPANGDAQWTLYRREGDPRLQSVDGRARPRAYGQAPKPAINWRAKADGFARNLTPDRANALAEALGLPLAVLSELPLLGFCANGPHKDETSNPLGECWTFPEVDSAGNVVGLTCRYGNGQKKAWPGGKRGLTVPTHWHERGGPILLPEGPSDVLASTGLGLSAVGRPSNSGGVRHLVELLSGVPADRPIIVLGELDANDKGQWPGRDSAVKTAGELAAKLSRPVQWALPPGGAKDARAWVQARKLDTTCMDAWHDAGEEFLSHLQLHAEVNTAAKEKPIAFGFRWEPIDSAAFAASDYRPAWLAKKALVEKQVAVIGGPQKVLKTSLAIDLAVSLASETPWLGEFVCPTRKRVAVLSGESGPWALQATARRVCAARGIGLADLGESLRWQFTLPQFALLEQLYELRAGLERDHVEVAIVDPLYLALLAGSDGLRAENLYETGPLLMRVAQACLDVGTTPILLHHSTKPSARKLEPLDLADLAFSGIAEFVRQWVLISRREAYDADTGTNRLWLSVGGSVGHGGLWAVDVEEGQLAEDFSGRKWQVTVTTAGDARKEERDSREQAKAKRKEVEAKVDAHKVLHSHGVNDPDNRGLTYTRLRESTGLSGPRFGAAITRLKDKGNILESDGTAPVGNRARRPARILRRRPSENQLPLEHAEALRPLPRRKPRAKTKKGRGKTTKEQPSENNRQG
jgi:hypothetical protein